MPLPPVEAVLDCAAAALEVVEEEEATLEDESLSAEDSSACKEVRSSEITSEELSSLSLRGCRVHELAFSPLP